MTSSSLKRESTAVRAGAFQLTLATNAPASSVIVVAMTPPVPPGPWQLAQFTSYRAEPRFSLRMVKPSSALVRRAGSASQ